MLQSGRFGGHSLIGKPPSMATKLLPFLFGEKIKLGEDTVKVKKNIKN